MAHPFISRAQEADPVPSLPELDLQPRELACAVKELAAYHEIFSPLFQRCEQRGHALTYLHGLLLPLDFNAYENEPGCAQ